jgi:hypothetical protein
MGIAPTGPTKCHLSNGWDFTKVCIYLGYKGVLTVGLSLFFVAPPKESRKVQLIDIYAIVVAF